MVGATVLGVFLQGLPHDRRVAMARVASLIRRAARGVRGTICRALRQRGLFGRRSHGENRRQVTPRPEEEGKYRKIYRIFRKKSLTRLYSYANIIRLLSRRREH